MVDAKALFIDIYSMILPWSLPPQTNLSGRGEGARKTANILEAKETAGHQTHILCKVQTQHNVSK